MRQREGWLALKTNYKYMTAIFTLIYRMKIAYKNYFISVDITSLHSRNVIDFITFLRLL